MHQLLSPDTLRSLAEAERDHPVEIARVRRALDGDGLLDDALAGTTDPRLLFAGFQIAFRSGQLDRAEDYARRRLGTSDKARALNNLGLIQFTRGALEAAEVLFRQALDLDRAGANPEGIARDLGSLSLVPEARGDLTTAAALNREALAIAEAHGFHSIIATRSCNLGEIALLEGRPAEAIPLLARAVALFTELGETTKQPLAEAALTRARTAPE